jgi:GGDEF domain-containing protein
MQRSLSWLRAGPVSPLKALAALLLAWIAIGLAAVVSFDPSPTRVAAPTLVGVVAVCGLWRPIRGAGVLLAIPALAVYAILSILWVREVSGSPLVVLPALFALAVSLLGTGVLAETLASRAERDSEQHRLDRLVIDELTPTYPGTDALKWEHARRAIRDEIVRARRFDHPFALAFLRIVDWDRYVEEHGTAPAQDHLVRLVLALQKLVRATDRLAFHSPGQLAVLMPHTTQEAAIETLRQIGIAAENQTAIEFRAGVAEFPEDALDADGLVGEAEHALEFAHQFGGIVSSRGLLGASP